MTDAKSQHRWPDTLMTAFAPTIWGSTYIVTTELLPADRPFTAASLRVLPAGLLLVLGTRQFPRRNDWAKVAALSILNIGAFQALLFVAAYRLPGGLAAVIGSIKPLLVMVLAWAVDGRRPVGGAVAAGVLGMAGMVAMLATPDSHWDPVGLAAAFVGIASMAAGTFLGHRWRVGLPVLALTGWQLFLGGLMLAPVAWAAEPPLPPLGAGAMAGYAYLSVVGALIAYALWFRGVARLPPVASSSLGLLSPLTAVTLGWVVLGQALTGPALAGLVVVLGSVLAVQWIAKAPG